MTPHPENAIETSAIETIAAHAIPISPEGQKDPQNTPQSTAPSTAPSARYALGIDLGTTHCALSWVDMAASDGEQVSQGMLDIPQRSGPASVQRLPLLPSFIYLPHESEIAPGDGPLPGQAADAPLAGLWARERGAATPMRLVASAKSWLCHSGIDRRAPLLPLDAPEDTARLSPLAASTAYLQHLRWAWDSTHPESPLDQQRVTVTIPASFDPAARALTASACEAAGLGAFTLLEEPQAALYSWLQASAGAWRKQVQSGDVLLVVDVGGGTTDLSLIAVGEQAGELVLQRVAVGDHILLGGDNMDLALAYSLAQQQAQAGKPLDAWQIRALAQGCRSAKEQLLSNADLSSVPVVIPSRGSRLIGASVRTEVTRAQVEAVLIEGFFPRVAVTDAPQTRARAALTQQGLPYAQDAAITRHLAAFLTRQKDACAALGSMPAAPGGQFARPSAVLFNGGVLKAEAISARIMATLNDWLAAEGAPAARLLDGAELDVAVARGAAYLGWVQAQGQGVRIRGGTAQSYYIGIESNMPAIPGMEPPLSALCLAPFGMEEGTEVALSAQTFGLVVGEPVQLRFFGSSVRRSDAVGQLLEYWSGDELTELQAIEATLPVQGRSPGDIVAVTLHARASEIGTLELIAVPLQGDERWRLEFDTRQTAQTTQSAPSAPSAPSV